MFTQVDALMTYLISRIAYRIQILLRFSFINDFYQVMHVIIKIASEIIASEIIENAGMLPEPRVSRDTCRVTFHVNCKSQ